MFTFPLLISFGQSSFVLTKVLVKAFVAATYLYVDLCMCLFACVSLCL